MRIKLLAFGILKDWLGGSTTVELPEGATVASLLVHLQFARQKEAKNLNGIAVGVNARYAPASQILRDGDEVALLPPVSGGCRARGEACVPGQNLSLPVHAALTREPIFPQPIIEKIRHPQDGAIVVFDGMVRNNSRGRQTLFLDYEAYEEMALRQMNELARNAIDRFGVRHVTLLHRLGRLNVGETSVLIVVASAHRAQAYEASRWLIDTLKKTVPIWKKETFVDGAVWTDGEPFPAAIALAPEEDPHAS